MTSQVFNDANGTTLAVKDANWLGDNTGLEVQSSVLQITNTSTFVSRYVTYSTGGGSKQVSEIVLKPSCVFSAGEVLEAIVQYTSSVSLYSVRVDATNVTLKKNGSFISQAAHGFTISAAGNKVRIESNFLTGVVSVYINSSRIAILTTTDGSPLSGGLPGMFFNAQGTAANIGVVSWNNYFQFGSAVGTDTYPTSSNRALVSKFTLADDAQIAAVHIRFDSASVAGCNAKALVYSNSSGNPNALLGVSSGKAIPAGGGDIEFPLSLTLAPGDYWLGGVTDSFEAVWSAEALAANAQRKETFTYATPSNPFGTADDAGVGTTLDAYASYDLAILGPTIDVPPLRVTKKIGQTASFSVTATASAGSLTYQWQKQQGGSFSNISGETASAYTTAALTASDSAGIRCAVTDSNGTTNTAVASLLVARARRPAEAQPGRFADFRPLEPIVGKGKFTLTQNELFGITASTITTIIGQLATFSLAGIAASLKRQRLISAALSTFSLGAQAAGLSKQYRSVNNVSAFVLAGQIVALRASRNVGSTVASFAAAGQVASLKYNRLSSNANASFALTAQAAGLSRSAIMQAVLSAFAVSGQAVNLQASRFVAATVAAFTYAGIAATLSRTVIMPAEAASFSLQGSAVALLAARRLGAAASTFALSGNAAGLFKNVRVIADVGTFTLQAQNTTLQASRRVTGAPAAFTLSAQAVGLLASRSVGSELALFVLGAQAAGLRRNARLAAELATFGISAKDVTLTRLSGDAFNAGAFVLGAQDVQFLLSQKIASEVSSFLVSGQAANLNRNRRNAQEFAAFSLSAKDATLTRLAGQTFLPASFALTGRDTEFVLNQALASGFSSFAVGAQIVLLHKLSKIDLASISFSVSGIDANFLINAGAAFENAAFDLSGNNVALLVNKKAQTASFLLLGVDADLRYLPSYIRSDERTYIVAGESRLYSVDAESRLYSVDAEIRVHKTGSENRKLVVS